MTEDEQIQKIERERRKREAALLILLLLLSEKARQLVGASIRMGVDPTLPIRQVIMGDANLHLPGLPGMLAAAMADAHVAGFNRAFDMADEPLVEVSPLDVLPLYRPGAFEIARGVVDSLTGIVQQSMADGVKAQLRTAGIARATMRAITRYGWSKFSPQSVAPESTGSPGYAASTVATNAVLTSWSGGFWNGVHHPAASVQLAGFRHVSVLDHRTSDICIARGEPSVQYRKDDPYFKFNVPPLHPRCRSLLIPLYGEGHDWTETYPQIPPAPGWGRAPGLMFGMQFGRAA